MSQFKWMNSLLKLLYPPKCILCRKLLDELDGEYVCRLCLNQYHQERPNVLKDEMIMREVSETLLTGEQEIDGNLEESREESDHPAQIIALFPYTGHYRKSILRWKYSGIRKYAKGYGGLLVEEQHCFQDLRPDLLIPVPLAPSRMRKRGFNQALDLAEVIGEKADVPVWDCLIRNKDTKPQAQCSREERYKNIQGTIEFKEVNSVCLEENKIIRTTDEWGVVEERMADKEGQKLKPHINYIALVDDIYTTGSTAKECIQVLRKQEVFKDARIIMLVAGKGDF